MFLFMNLMLIPQNQQINKYYYFYKQEALIEVKGSKKVSGFLLKKKTELQIINFIFLTFLSV